MNTPHYVQGKPLPPESEHPDSANDHQTRPQSEPGRAHRVGIIAAIVGLVLLVLIVLAVIGLVNNPPLAATLRDLFIIALALESFVIGLVLLVLVIQVTRLVDLLQNEIRPILDSTNQTVSTLRGTTVFMSENVISPVVTLSSYVAGVRRAWEVLTGFRRPR